MNSRQHEGALFLPFMQIPTGHHHVADAVMEELEHIINEITCEKVDILSYSYGKIEKLVTATYLNSIRIMPKAYNSLYHFLAVKNQSKRSRQFLYELLFTSFFKRLILQHHPRVLFCTHCLPSNIASVLKEKGKLQAITVNVYTDFFVNRVWGIRGIDYHFVPSIRVKQFLLNLGVKEEKIFVTGIPIHPIFHKHQDKKGKMKNHILIAGGSLGVGSMEKLIPKNPTLTYSVLCGHNRKLHEHIIKMNHPQIIPIPYLHSKEAMNHLYHQVDAVITKPGGVTISECLHKQIPIFTCNALPGQEKINEMELRELGIINSLDPFINIETQILDFFLDQDRLFNYQENIKAYHQDLDIQSLSDILLSIYK
ncbi:MGDG synthase family glycosyltransferase [Ornithinibacillus halotolerans]|uniref:Glycosyltransferase YkoN n=1 Tax=Ornithinibacillus halotolerans TaxID=1274357 RepID=A0A916W5F8_9BACI|nr:UDP-glucuronosyltransferase [Ornithinibacillus halotolerans]GGA67307.1 putative glycosyltransferase YkoN [Ornithinibacillus halotolerans]